MIFISRRHYSRYPKAEWMPFCSNGGESLKVSLFSSQVYSTFPHSTHTSRSWWSSKHHCDLGTPVSIGSTHNPSLSSSFPGRVFPRRQSEWMIKMLLLWRATNLTHHKLILPCSDSNSVSRISIPLENLGTLSLASSGHSLACSHIITVVVSRAWSHQSHCYQVCVSLVCLISTSGRELRACSGTLRWWDGVFSKPLT